MSADPHTWFPDSEELESSGVVQLMRALGAGSYDDLLRVSLG